MESGYINSSCLCVESASVLLANCCNKQWAVCKNRRIVSILPFNGFWLFLNFGCLPLWHKICDHIKSNHSLTCKFGINSFSFFHFQTEHHARSIVGIIEVHHCTLCSDKCCRYDYMNVSKYACTSAYIYMHISIYAVCLYTSSMAYIIIYISV